MLGDQFEQPDFAMADMATVVEIDAKGETGHDGSIAPWGACLLPIFAHCRATRKRWPQPAPRAAGASDNAFGGLDDGQPPTRNILSSVNFQPVGPSSSTLSMRFRGSMRSAISNSTRVGVTKAMRLTLSFSAASISPKERGC